MSALGPSQAAPNHAGAACAAPNGAYPHNYPYGWERTVPWWHPRRWLQGKRWCRVSYSHPYVSRVVRAKKVYAWQTDKERAAGALDETFSPDRPTQQAMGMQQAVFRPSMRTGGPKI
jgi:hypothetical protein